MRSLALGAHSQQISLQKCLSHLHAIKHLLVACASWVSVDEGHVYHLSSKLHHRDLESLPSSLSSVPLEENHIEIKRIPQTAAYASGVLVTLVPLSTLTTHHDELLSRLAPSFVVIENKIHYATPPNPWLAKSQVSPF